MKDLKKVKKILAVSLIMILALTAFTACGSKDTTEDEMTTLVLGTSADYAPFEFMYPDENGEMVYGGIDVDTAQYIADYMGVELQVENMSFSNLLTALGKGQFDIVLADIEATDERKEAADFSDPYLTEPAPHFLVKKENADQYKSYADFEGKDNRCTDCNNKTENGRSDSECKRCFPSECTRSYQRAFLWKGGCNPRRRFRSTAVPSNQ